MGRRTLLLLGVRLGLELELEPRPVAWSSFLRLRAEAAAVAAAWFPGATWKAETSREAPGPGG